MNARRARPSVGFPRGSHARAATPAVISDSHSSTHTDRIFKLPSCPEPGRSARPKRSRRSIRRVRHPVPSPRPGDNPSDKDSGIVPTFRRKNRRASTQHTSNTSTRTVAQTRVMARSIRCAQTPTTKAARADHARAAHVGLPHVHTAEPCPSALRKVRPEPEPPPASITTVSPASNSPARILPANGFSIRFWMMRASGRAPYAGS